MGFDKCLQSSVLKLNPSFDDLHFIFNKVRLTFVKLLPWNS